MCSPDKFIAHSFSPPAAQVVRSRQWPLISRYRAAVRTQLPKIKNTLAPGVADPHGTWHDCKADIRLALQVNLQPWQEDLSSTLSKLNISAVPTLYFFRDGKKVAEVIGADITKLKDAMEKLYKMPTSSNMEPRSSRLKDKMKGEGKVIVKELFVQNIIQHNDLVHFLLDEGSSCIVLPQNTFDFSLASSSHVRSQVKVKPRLSLGLCSREEALEASRSFLADDVMLDGNSGPGHFSRFCSVKENHASLLPKNRPLLIYSKFGIADISTAADSQNMDNKEKALHGNGLLDQGLLSCVTCGILSFACVAVVQPTDVAARYLMSSDCSYFNDHFSGSGVISDINTVTNVKTSNYSLAACSEV